MISGVEAVEVGGSGGAAGIGPGGSCRLRWACWLRFPSLARVVLPGIPVPFQLAPGVEVVEAVEVSADPAAGGCVSAGWLLAPAPSNGVGPSSWRGLRHYCGPGQPPAVRVGSMDGEGKAVQGLSCRRWRCWPSVLESSFLGRIQGVEAVEVGGCAVCWPPADPVGCGCGCGWACRLAGWLRLPPIQLARPPTLLRPGQPPAAAALAATSTAGKEDRTGAIVSAVEVLAVRPGILVPGSIQGVEVVEVGGWLAPGSLRHYCGPGQPPAAAALAATSTAAVVILQREIDNIIPSLHSFYSAFP